MSTTKPLRNPTHATSHRTAAQAPQQQHRQQQPARARFRCDLLRCRHCVWVTRKLRPFGCVCKPKFGCDYAVDICLGHMSQIDVLGIFFESKKKKKKKTSGKEKSCV